MKIFLFLIKISVLLKVNCIDFISKYDEVHYDTDLVKTKHERISRSLDSHLNINFKSFGKRFDLKLLPTESLFKHDYIEVDNKKHPTNKFIFYKGKLNNDQDSHVSGSIIDGVFYGTIKTAEGKYHVESSKRQNDSSIKSHSIIYHENDVKLIHNNLLKRDLLSHKDHLGCASEKVIETLKKIQERAFSENINSDFEMYYSRLKNTGNKYTKRANEIRREKDARNRIEFPDGKSVCKLFLKVDKILYNEIYKKEGNQNNDKTLDFLTNYLTKHVESLNSIYENLQLYNDEKSAYYTGVHFAIHRTKIITEEACNNQFELLSKADSLLCEPYLDVQTYLNYVSVEDYGQYCLGYAFTARDFADGTLGLAWVAKPSTSVGGVCEKRLTINGQMKSLNSGIVTLINYNSRVSDLVSQITFAHEVGHNFGSEHDQDQIKACTPGDSAGGNFIMYPRATTGNQKNNRNFSSCSLDSMGKAIHAIVSSKKFCFIENDGPICGNKIVEEGEQCDCGYADECKEQCCYNAETDKKCTLKETAICSPSQGSCCSSEECNYFDSSTVCLKSTDCLLDVYCSGNQSFCPTNNSVYFINQDSQGQLKECNGGSQVCKNGTCQGSICEKYDMDQCYLEGDPRNKNVDKERLCHLACLNKTTNICTDSADFLINSNSNKPGFLLKPGSACANTLGYCDIFSKCRSVDAEGPLTKLKKLLSNPDIAKTAMEWITTYWYFVVLIILGVIILMGLFIKVCSVHTKSDNPNYPKESNIRESMRRPKKQRPIGKISPTSRTTPSSNSNTKHKQKTSKTTKFRF